MEFDLLSYTVFFVAAFLGGFIDAIAGGGGLITLPAIMAMGVPPHLALGTNKLQGVFGSFTATLNFTKKGLINYKECFVGIVFTFIGALIGATLILFLNANFLKIIIPFLLIAIFIYTLFMPKIGESDRAAKMNERLFYVIFGLIWAFMMAFWTWSRVVLDVCDGGTYRTKFKKGGRSHESFKFYQQHRSSWRFYNWRTDTLASWLFDGCGTNFRSIFWLKFSHQKRG